MSEYTECYNCGWIGTLDEVLEHPTRPLPDEIGFCPECMKRGQEVECEEVFSEEEKNRRLAEYDE